jgi:hypothetical protein
VAKGNSVTNDDPLERIARLLAIIAVKDLEPGEAALRLLAVGFDAPTIGALLGKNPNFANAAKSRANKANRND